MTLDEEPDVASCTWKLSETGRLVKEVQMPGREVGGILLVDSNPLSGTPSVMGQRPAAAGSWQMLGSSVPFEVLEGATVVTQLEQKKTLVQGGGPASTLGHGGPGLEGPRSTGPGSVQQRSQAAKVTVEQIPEQSKPMEEKEDVDFYDSVSNVGRGGLGVRPRSNMTTASSVPGQRVGGTMNASALSARFMVDARIFEWTPQSVEEYLNCGQTPNGLMPGSGCHISALALGYDAEHNQYDAKSQIYNSAVWTKQLRSALIVLNCASWHALSSMGSLFFFI